MMAGLTRQQPIEYNQQTGCFNRSVLLTGVFSILLLLVMVRFSFGQELITKRVALVIGVQTYVSVPRLRNSLNDAHDMAKTLKSKDFQVIELYDPKTKKEIQNAVRKYFDLLRNHVGAAGILYYSGHGIQVKGSNYFIPTTADPKIEADLDDQCVKMEYILSALEEASNSLNIMILDACRSNPFRGFSRTTEKGLNMVDAPKGSYIVYATKPGSVASDGNGRNGLFTSKLLKYINTPNLNIEQVFKKVAFDVSQESGESQRPWIASDYTGDFYFSKDNNSPITIAVTDKPVNDSPLKSEALEKSLLREDEANFFFHKAEKEFEQANYSSTLDYLNQSESILGSGISKIIYMRVKAYDKIQKESRDNYLNLKKNVDEFLKLPSYDDVRVEKYFEVMEIKNAIARFDLLDLKMYNELKEITNYTPIGSYISQNKNSSYYSELLDKHTALTLIKRGELIAKMDSLEKQMIHLQRKLKSRRARKVVGGILVGYGLLSWLHLGTGNSNNIGDAELIITDVGALVALPAGCMFLLIGPKKKKIMKQIDQLNQEKKELQITLDGLVAS